MHPRIRYGCLLWPLSRPEPELLLRVATETVLSAHRLAVDMFGARRPNAEELTTGTEAPSVSRGGVNELVMVADRV
jgi:hypothetical protein